jgi:precorrin-3B synthase
MRIGENFCPGILHAVPAKDGMLIRIRVPGGLLYASQMNAVARISTQFANGEIEITSRSNLQLRAIKDRDLPVVVELLSSAALLPSRQHDRVRNIVTSPLTGLDPEEMIDTRPLVRELDRRLIADPVFAELHPKFSFGIDGGGQKFIREVDDLSLEALRSHGEFQLYLGGANTDLSVSTTQSVDCLLEAAKLCIILAKKAGLPLRGKALNSVPDMMTTIAHELSRFGTASIRSKDSTAALQTPIGILPAIHTDQVNIFPLVPLGRLTSIQAQRISELITDCEGDLRLAPWRGVILGAVPQRFVTTITTQLNSAGLSLNANDGFRGIAACAGSSGCDASLADVRGDANLLAQNLAGLAIVSDWTVNISGCEKQCAMRRGAIVELVADTSGYSLRLNGEALESNLSSHAAINAVLSAHANYVSRVAS